LLLRLYRSSEDRSFARDDKQIIKSKRQQRTTSLIHSQRLVTLHGTAIFRWITQFTERRSSYASLFCARIIHSRKRGRWFGTRPHGGIGLPKTANRSGTALCVERFLFMSGFDFRGKVNGVGRSAKSFELLLVDYRTTASVLSFHNLQSSDSISRCVNNQGFINFGHSRRRQKTLPSLKFTPSNEWIWE